MADPKRSEVWLVDLGYVAKVRPCLVLSVPFEGEERSLVSLVPHTTSSRPSRFEVAIPVSYLKTGSFDAQSLVTVPTVKLIRRLGTIPMGQLAQIESAVVSWLGLGQARSGA